MNKKDDISKLNITSEEFERVEQKINSEKNSNQKNDMGLPVNAKNMELTKIIGELDFANVEEKKGLFETLDNWRHRRIIRKHHAETRKIVADAKEQALRTEVASWLSSYAAIHKANFDKVVTTVRSIGTTMLHDFEIKIQESIQFHTAQLDANLENEMEHIDSTALPEAIKKKRYLKAVENYWRAIDKISNEVYKVNEDELFEEYKSKAQNKKK